MGLEGRRRCSASFSILISLAALVPSAPCLHSTGWDRWSWGLSAQPSWSSLMVSKAEDRAGRALSCSDWHFQGLKDDWPWRVWTVEGTNEVTLDRLTFFYLLLLPYPARAQLLELRPGAQQSHVTPLFSSLANASESHSLTQGSPLPNIHISENSAQRMHF